MSPERSRPAWVDSLARLRPCAVRLSSSILLTCVLLHEAGPREVDVSREMGIQSKPRKFKLASAARLGSARGKVDIWLPGNGPSNSLGTMPDLQTSSLKKWTRSSWLAKGAGLGRVGYGRGRVGSHG